MKKKLSRKAGALFAAMLMLSSLCSAKSKKGESTMSLSRNLWKKVSTANPISPNVFCADPTSVEYQGRIYVYGTVFKGSEKHL